MLKDLSKQLARISLSINAIKLNPKQPFLWASGYYMPIYNDNRLLLGSYAHRRLVSDGFVELARNLAPEVIAGTATAGIPPATTLADRLELPLVYVRSSAKEHGLRNSIEGILRQGQKVVMVEDLVSTGGSSISAIKGIREAGGVLDHCLAIFSYQLPAAEKQFAEIACQVTPLLRYDTLLEVAREEKYINQDELELLAQWREDPFAWGERFGFAPRN